MKIKEIEKKLLAELDEIRAYNHALATLSYDHYTIAPKKANQEQNETMAILSNIVFKKEHSPEFINLLKDAYAVKEKFNPCFKRTIEKLYEDYEKTKNISSSLAYQIEMDLAKSYDDWLKAKEKSDYNLFIDSFRKVVSYSRQLIDLRDNKKEIKYDNCLDDYEPNYNIPRMDKFFAELKEGILPLLEKIKKSPKKIRSDFLHNKVKISKQEAFSHYILKVIGFDANAGMMSTTEHPFTNVLSHHDVRITTHFYENDFVSNIFTTAHEGGHAIFGQNEPNILHKYHTNDLMTSAMHECMSRLYENIVARSKEFIHVIYPRFKRLFKAEFKDVSEEELYEAVNIVTPSLIRTDSDELTYCLHIIIRYEIEKELVNGTLEVEDAKRVWNEKYKQYLGLDDISDSEGILQDVHWSGMSFGYFPTYALGNAYSAQIFHKMNEDFDVKQAIYDGKVHLVRDWLKKHAFAYASMLDPDEWIIKVTGEPLNTKYYLDYLKDKFAALYDLK